MQNYFRFTILGTEIELMSNSETSYMREVLFALENKIASIQEGLKVQDPLKTALLTSFLLVDDLLSERSERKSTSLIKENQEEAEKITVQLIDNLRNLQL